MDAPKCKVCGSKHWGPCYVPPARVVIDDPGHQPSAARARRLRAGLSKRLTSDLPPMVVKSKPVRGRPLSTGETEGKSKRAAYQRDYMRKKRAKT